MKRIRRGWALTKKSWALLNSHRELVRFPVIAIEGTGPLPTVKRSAALFRERWGQQITGNIAIGGVVFLLGFLPGIALIVVGVVIWPSVGIAGGALAVIGALVICVALLVSKALSGIFGVALYRYATDGEVVGGFTQEDLESAVRPKRGAKLSGATPGTA